MKCKICGVELKKEGEICNNCMNKIMMEQEIVHDNQEIYEFKPTFAIGYEILSHIDSVAIAIFLFAILISLGKEYLQITFIAIIFFLIWGILYLIYKKYFIKHINCIFYKTKFVYHYRKIRKKSITIHYRDIKEINYEKTKMGNIFNLGNIIIKTNSKNLLKRNIIIESVRNVEEVLMNVQKIFKIR